MKLLKENLVKKEIAILKGLSDMDAENRHHIVRLVSHFQHRGHLCMVFESLNMNLREVVKRFGKLLRQFRFTKLEAFEYLVFVQSKCTFAFESLLDPLDFSLCSTSVFIKPLTVSSFILHSLL